MYADLTEAQEARLSELQDNLDKAVEETQADIGDDFDVNPDDLYHDLLFGVLADEPDITVARELCRITVGVVPWDLKSRLGDFDWVV